MDGNSPHIIIYYRPPQGDIVVKVAGEGAGLTLKDHKIESDSVKTHTEDFGHVFVEVPAWEDHPNAYLDLWDDHRETHVSREETDDARRSEHHRITIPVSEEQRQRAVDKIQEYLGSSREYKVSPIDAAKTKIQHAEHLLSTCVTAVESVLASAGLSGLNAVSPMGLWNQLLGSGSKLNAEVQQPISSLRNPDDNFSGSQNVHVPPPGFTASGITMHEFRPDAASTQTKDTGDGIKPQPATSPGIEPIPQAPPPYGHDSSGHRHRSTTGVDQAVPSSDAKQSQTVDPSLKAIDLAIEIITGHKATPGIFLGYSQGDAPLQARDANALKPNITDMAPSGTQAAPAYIRAAVAAVTGKDQPSSGNKSVEQQSDPGSQQARSTPQPSSSSGSADAGDAVQAYIMSAIHQVKEATAPAPQAPAPAVPLP